MQTETVTRTLATSGSTSSAMFGMDSEDSAHIFSVLRGSLYSAKEQAVLREYSCNAWDEHVDAGIPDRPIKVVLPTEIEPTLVIRDYGRGLSEANVFGIYAKYGKSTKRTNANAIGFLGLGSKSAFAYSDTFTIISHHGGLKSLYVAAIDTTNVGTLVKLHEEPWDGENGVEIRVPVQYQDIDTFRKEAQHLFRFMTPLPDINIPVSPPNNIDKKINGYILGKSDSDSGHVWTAIMGPVPYRLDLNRLTYELRAEGLEDLARTVTGGLFFALGEVSVAAHREELEYTTRTKAAIVARLKLLFSEYTQDLDEVTSDPNASIWAKRMAVHAFRKRTGLPVPTKYREWMDTSIKVYSFDNYLRDGDGNMVRDPATGKAREDIPSLFRIMGFPYKRGKYGDIKQEHLTMLAARPEIEVLPTTRILIRDTTRAAKGYGLSVDDHIITPTDLVLKDPLSLVGICSGSDDPMWIEINTWLDKAKLSGIPLLRMSQMPWDPKAPSAPRNTKAGPTFNQKHVERHFILKSDISEGRAGSHNWDIIDRVPEPTDVHVILSHFKVIDNGNFFAQVKEDRKYVKYLGGTFPTIVGIKTLVKKPVVEGELRSIPYKKWRETIVEDLLRANPEVQAKIEAFEWYRMMQGLRYYSQGVRAVLAKHLPAEHPLLSLYTSMEAGSKQFNTLTHSEREMISRLRDTLQAPFMGVKTLAGMYTRYPLIAPKMHGPDFGVVTTPEGEHWIRYILLMDEFLTAPVQPLEQTA